MRNHLYAGSATISCLIVVTFLGNKQDLPLNSHTEIKPNRIVTTWYPRMMYFLPWRWERESSGEGSEVTSCRRLNMGNRNAGVSTPPFFHNGRVFF